MAIEISVELNNGLTVDKGYFRIDKLSLDATCGMVSFSGELFASKKARDEGYPPVNGMYYNNSFIADDKTGNLIEQAYLYIKQLAEKYDNEKEIFAQGKDI